MLAWVLIFAWLLDSLALRRYVWWWCGVWAMFDVRSVVMACGLGILCCVCVCVCVSICLFVCVLGAVAKAVARAVTCADRAVIVVSGS